MELDQTSETRSETGESLLFDAKTTEKVSVVLASEKLEKKIDTPSDVIAATDDEAVFELDLTSFFVEELKKYLPNPRKFTKQCTLVDIKRSNIAIHKKQPPPKSSLLTPVPELPDYYALPGEDSLSSPQNCLDLLIREINTECDTAIPAEMQKYIEERCHQDGFLWTMTGSFHGLVRNNTEYLFDKKKRIAKIKVINQHTIEIEEENNFFGVRDEGRNIERLIKSSSQKPLFRFTDKLRISFNPTDHSVTHKFLSVRFTSNAKAEGYVKDLIDAINKNPNNPHEWTRTKPEESVTKINIPISSILVVGLFVMLALFVFRSSIDFGLAMPEGFLMTGALISPLAIFTLAALALALVAHLVVRKLKSSVADIPACQTIASALEANKILEKWDALEESGTVSSEACSSFVHALQVPIRRAKALLNRHPALVYYDGQKGNAAVKAAIKDYDNLRICTGNIINNRKELLDIFKNIKNSIVDPYYRPSYATIFKVLWSLISIACLVGCVITLFYIFTTGVTLSAIGTMSGMAWSMSLAAILGFMVWQSAKHVLSKISGGPYATLTAVLGIGLVTFVTLWAAGGAGLPVAVLGSVTGSLIILCGVCARLAAVNIRRTPAQRMKSVAFLSTRSIQFNALLGTTLLISLIACVVPLFFIATGALSPWVILLAMPSGCVCLGLTDYALNRISGSPFATSAGISVISLITIILVWLLRGAELSMPFLGVTLGLLASSIISVVLLSQDEGETIESVSQDGARLLRALKIVSIVGFLFLAFLSMALIFQLGNIGQLNGMLGDAFDVIAERLGYGGFEIGAQWMSAFFVGIFATSGFIAFELLKSVLQRMPVNGVEFEQQEGLVITGVMLLKLVMTIGVITCLAAMPSVFVVPGSSADAMLPIFLVVAGVMPLFSGNANLPYFKTFNQWFNPKFGIQPLIGKNRLLLALKYVGREVVIIFILFIVPGCLFYAGTIDNLSFAVLGVGVGVTVVFRISTMLWNAYDPLVLARAYLRHEAILAESKTDIDLDDISLPRDEQADDDKETAGEKNDEETELLITVGNDLSKDSNLFGTVRDHIGKIEVKETEGLQYSVVHKKEEPAIAEKADDSISKTAESIEIIVPPLQSSSSAADKDTLPHYLTSKVDLLAVSPQKPKDAKQDLESSISKTLAEITLHQSTDPVAVAKKLEVEKTNIARFIAETGDEIGKCQKIGYSDHHPKISEPTKRLTMLKKFHQQIEEIQNSLIIPTVVVSAKILTGVNQLPHSHAFAPGGALTIASPTPTSTQGELLYQQALV